jgi:hypothetical protein
MISDEEFDRQITFQKRDGTKVELSISRKTIEELTSRLGRDVSDSEVMGYIMTGLRNGSSDMH